MKINNAESKFQHSVFLYATYAFMYSAFESIYYILPNHILNIPHFCIVKPLSGKVIEMNNVNILSKDHFAAHQQVVSDYKLLLICESELASYNSRKKNPTGARLKKEIITILQRIIENKNVLTENTKADQEYLSSLINGI